MCTCNTTQPQADSREEESELCDVGLRRSHPDQVISWTQLAEIAGVEPETPPSPEAARPLSDTCHLDVPAASSEAAPHVLETPAVLETHEARYNETDAAIESRLWNHAPAMFVRKHRRAAPVIIRCIMKSMKSVQQVQNLISPVGFGRLQVLLLSGNRLKDLTLLHACPKLRLLDLSFNLITKLPQAQVFAACPELRFCYLNDNALDWPALDALDALPPSSGILALTLAHNPLANHPQYRHLIVNRFPRLELLVRVC